MYEGLLPVGTVVLLKNSTKRVMIMGVCQKEAAVEKIWDYCGCLYPEGYIGADKVFLFNGSQIERIYAIGYQDSEQMEFKKKADEALSKLRGEGKR